MFNMFTIMFCIVFVLVISVFIVTFIRGIGQWSKNNNSPRLRVDATVVSKRAYTSHHMHNNGVNMHTTASTSYYVTFQVESGDRMELCVSGAEYGMIAEGDAGILSFQGTRYLGFERR